MKKNRLTVTLVLMIAASILLGCSTSTNNPTDSADALQESSPPVSSDEISELTALEVANLMGNGTNLGNTMEAYGHNTLGIDADISSYETLWGQPITTPEMLTAMKASGFDTIRIPVAWTNTMNYENGDYTISEEYFDRVGEIINYALDADMFVIFNDHWDGSWWGMFGSANPETREQAMEIYISMWTQIAEKYKHFSHKLIFESANEELGNRLNDMDVARDSGALSEDECYEMNNIINQTFVDAIRKSGGNNANRFLLIAGYNTDITMTCDDRFIMPTDTVPDKLLLSVHYYTPWSYCGTSGVATWGTENHYNNQNELLANMTKFTDQGYGIVFGEYAVLPKSDGTIKNNTLDFVKNFLDNCDLYGYVPILWDTNNFFIRTELKITDEGLSNLFEERSLAAQSSLTQEKIKENAKQSMTEAIEIAIENDVNSVGTTLFGDEDAIAWIMFNSLDYNITYSVGDIYDPTLVTEGIIANDVKIEEAGTYTVSLDFTDTEAGYADSTAFSALGISNGELLFPDYLITIKEIKINDAPYDLTGIPYTIADDEICTRVNLYNGWVSEISKQARCSNPNMRPYLSATIIDPQTLGHIETISVTFEYAPLG